MEVINMARPRLALDNASYHVMVRGNQKQAIFLEEADFLKYLEILRHYKRKYKFKLYGYCLMPNHVHLIIDVENAKDLCKAMQGLSLTYTLWFNKKYKKVGHLWQGRYKNMLIQKNKYMVDCIEYVELNPMRANLARSLSEYPWSSWQTRMGCTQDRLLDFLEAIPI
jgi:putative transposase